MNERIIKKVIVGYAYPRNGNCHNPTPHIRWYLIENGQIIDSRSKLNDLKEDYPGVKVSKQVIQRGERIC